MEKISDLPSDIWIEIAKRLNKFQDFIYFRCVSKSIRAVVMDQHFNGLRFRPRTPYLMLPVTDDNNNTRDFYSLVEGESIVSSLKVANFNTKKCFESLGWLLVVQRDGSMNLLQPFSGTEIPLPHQDTFPDYLPYRMNPYIFIQKMLLSARPNEDSNFVLMIIAANHGHLAFWRLGDKEWNKIEDHRGRFTDVVYGGGGGQFYASGYPGIVWVFNLSETDNQVESRIIIRLPEPVCSGNLYILKTVDGSLLAITRTIEWFSEDGSYNSTYDFDVHAIDITAGTLEEIDNLGTMALFIGENSTILVDASRLSGGGVIKANHIYFTDDNWEYYHRKKEGGGADIGVYDMETGDIEPIYPGEPLTSKVSPSIWISPCFSE